LNTSSSILTICHGFSCAYRSEFALTQSRFVYLRGLLGRPRSATEERKTINRAIAWFDREIGRVAGTVNRVAYASATTKSGPSQMDCIDLTANVTQFLLALDRAKLLKFHRVGEPTSRGFLIDGKQPHTTPVIVEAANGVEWSVDSWTRSYGQLPEVMPIEEWKNKK
jgi:hypothetical protein